MNKKMMPEVRFEGFSGEWGEHKLGEVTTSYSGGTPSVGNKDYYTGSIPFIRSGEISGYTTQLFINELAISNSSAKMVDKGDVLYALYGATSGEVSLSNIRGAVNQAVLVIIPEKGVDSKFLVQFLKKEKSNILDKYLQGGQGNLSGGIIKSIPLKVPDISEQVRIGGFLNKIESVIYSKQNDLQKLTQFKQAMLQKMFPKEGEKEPEVRFEGFSEEWELSKFGNILNYEQPTKYIVESDKYMDNQKTPVLTAGKSLLLGYTDETQGIYRADDKRGVIIFDDFTTSSHIINYDFKVKSSALKLLTTTSDKFDLYFAHELIQSMNFQPGNHERHWISIFAKLDILIPSKNEQIAIGNFFKNLDNKIELEEQNLEKLNQFKKAMLQKMFV